ncbi:hypothetical protein CYY_010179 [Polysphondylium violaceum]|uniref:Uncharacterized protein n=1 Tax=Polysphondylium violaceum TaxID=133409 RepID=A0A8J4PLS4_9MYCE|nr:hypothetical protein CYY_010179 [Polysphondylium violaceum]
MDLLYRSVFNNSFLKQLVFKYIKILTSIRANDATLGFMVRNKLWTLLNDKLKNQTEIVCSNKDYDLIYSIKDPILFEKLFKKFQFYFSKIRVDNSGKEIRENCIGKAIEFNNWFAVDYLYKLGYPIAFQIHYLDCATNIK